MGNARHVMHVSQPSDGGVAAYVFRMALAQRDRGWSVSVASPPGGELARRLQDAGIRHLGWSARRAPGAGLVREALSLSRLLAHERPDVVHLHSSKAGLAGRLLPRSSATVFQPHGWAWHALPAVLRPAAAAWERRGARRTDALVCVSAVEKNEGINAGISAAWSVIPNGVEPADFPPVDPAATSSIRSALGLEDGPTAVCVATFRPAKGHALLLRAWSTVERAVPPARLVLVGDGPDRRRIERSAPTSVRFVGHHDDVAPWLAAADVVVVPSRRDAMSLVVLEAMAAGRSIVATAVPTAREVVGDAGAIVPLDDPAILADAVIERLTDPDLTTREGIKGRARILRSYRFDETVGAMVGLYEGLLERDQA